MKHNEQICDKINLEITFSMEMDVNPDVSLATTSGSAL